jgi:hypothetical protein
MHRRSAAVERISIEERIEGFKRFFRMDNPDGPLVGFFRDTYYPLKRFRTESFLPAGRIGPADLDVESFLPEYERIYRLQEETSGDFIWTASAFWGIPWMEALAGCRVEADHQTGSTRSIAPVDFAGSDAIPHFDRESPWPAKAREFLVALDALSAGRFPLGTTLMRGVSDLLSALYGTPDFLYQAFDDPEEVRKMAERLTALWIDFARLQLDAIPDFHGGTGSYFYGAWLPGRGVWYQEDATALMSPSMYGDLVAPAIDAVASSFDTTIIHLHPSTCISAAALAESKLSAIEMHIDFGGPSAEDLLPFYRTIQRDKPLIVWGDLNDADLACIERNLDPSGLAIIPVVETRERAEAIWKRFRR